MSRPPKTTISFLNLPPESSQWLFGIDFQFFSLKQIFKGIKLIPDGVHILHYSEAATDKTKPDQDEALSSLRYGTWLECREQSVHIFFWDEDLHLLVLVDKNLLDYSKGMGNLGENYKYMVDFPGDEVEWNNMTSMIDFEVIEEYLPIQFDGGLVSTIVPSREERIALSDAMSRGSAILAASTEQIDEELQYTIVQFDKPRTNRIGRERTEDHFDKTWLLEELYGHDIELLIAELQLSFINFVTVGSFCSGMQWLTLAKLVLASKHYLQTHKNFLLTFMQCFYLQLRKLPSELLVDELKLHNQLNIKIYVEIMENFCDYFDQYTSQACCGKLKVDGLLRSIWNNVIAVNKKFGLDLNHLKRQVDEENMEVFNLNDYDEGDEDMPVIV